MTMLTDFAHAFLSLWLDAAFWLLFGLAVAGALHSFVSSERLARHLGGSGFMPSIKAALLGAPLPLCSCGVIPAAVGLRRAGASKSATTSFLVSTPETGIDSIAISYALLGPFLTVARLVAALCSALTAAALTLWWAKNDPVRATPATSGPCCDPVSSAASTSCCSPAQPTAPSCSSTTASVDSCCEETPPPSSCCTTAGAVSSCCTPREAAPSCCSPTAPTTACSAAVSRAPAASTLLSRAKRGLHFAFYDLFADIAVWLIVGIAFSALVVAFVPDDFLARITHGWAAMLVMVLIGVPMYICASASTPLAAGLLLAGVSPGAVLVFLLAGPATNLATLGIVRRELGTRTLSAYLIGVIAVAIAFGYLTNGLVSLWSIDLRAELAASGTLIPGWLSVIAGIVLAVLTLGLFVRQLRQHMAKSRSTAKQCGCC